MRLHRAVVLEQAREMKEMDAWQAKHPAGHAEAPQRQGRSGATR
jgi:hypothetical protein